jgi:hypothetical protein
MPTLPDEADPAGSAARSPFGALRAALDAIFKEDDRIGGRAVTRLTAALPADDVTGMLVESTIGFGEWVDHEVDPAGAGSARVLINGEIITAATRRSRYPFQFETLTRGVSNTEVRGHPAGSLVYDLSHNTSAVDHLRRGFLVEYAIGEDLEILARNLGLHRCPGVTQEQLRRIIKAVAYLPKQTVHAFREALTALFGSSSAFTIIERTTTDPFVVYVEIAIALSTDIRGRFFLNGGYPATIDGGGTTVTLPFTPNHVIGVYVDNPLSRRGFRSTFTNYFASFLGPVITLAALPAPTLLAANANPGDPTIRPIDTAPFPNAFPYYVQLVDGVSNEIVRIIGKQTLPFAALIVDPLTPIVGTYAAGPGTVAEVYVPGTPVLVDGGWFEAHYLALNETVRQDIGQADRWAYLADPLFAASCLLDQIRAAGVQVRLSTRL